MRSTFAKAVFTIALIIGAVYAGNRAAGSGFSGGGGGGTASSLQVAYNTGQSVAETNAFGGIAVTTQPNGGAAIPDLIDNQAANSNAMLVLDKQNTSTRNGIQIIDESGSATSAGYPGNIVITNNTSGYHQGINLDGGEFLGIGYGHGGGGGPQYALDIQGGATYAGSGADYLDSIINFQSTQTTAACVFQRIRDSASGAGNYDRFQTSGTVDFYMGEGTGTARLTFENFQGQGLGLLRTGDLTLNNSGTENATGATGPFAFIPTWNGVPTGVPASAFTGAAAFGWDRADNELFVYNSGWQNVVTGSAPAASAQQTVYVSKAGSDSTGAGTILTPYLTIAHALSTISDAAATKVYTIYIGPGTYAETPTLKAFCYLQGCGSGFNGGNQATYFAGDSIVIINGMNVNDASWATTRPGGGVADVQLAGASNTINFDLSAHTATTAPASLSFRNVFFNVTGTATFKGGTTYGDGFVFWNCEGAGTSITLDSGIHTLYDCFFNNTTMNVTSSRSGVGEYAYVYGGNAGAPQLYTSQAVIIQGTFVACQAYAQANGANATSVTVVSDATCSAYAAQVGNLTNGATLLPIQAAFPAIVSWNTGTGRTASLASVCSYTATADTSFEISANLNVTATAVGLKETVTYNDENGTARALTLNFSNVAGTIGTTCTTTGAYEGVVQRIRCGAGAITVATVETSGTYNFDTHIMEVR